MEQMVKFKQLIEDNEEVITSFMKWNNYELNEVTLPVVEELKEHALMVLKQSYGRYDVEPEILDEVCSDVFMHFPNLMQQLAISRLMDAYGVVPEDTITETLEREENSTAATEQSSELTLGTQVIEENELDTQQKTTGTVTVDGDTSTTQNSTINIENTTGVDMTGSKTVNLSHNMPEQALSGITNSFPTDPEGTPILNNSTVQSANEQYNTHNPIDSQETSEQTNISTTQTESDSVTTNDVTVADTGSTMRTQTNSGSDSSESMTTSDETNTISETRTRTETNKQYAYEIKAFLESTETVNAFENWVDKFSWVVGII